MVCGYVHYESGEAAQFKLKMLSEEKQKILSIVKQEMLFSLNWNCCLVGRTVKQQMSGVGQEMLFNMNWSWCPVYTEYTVIIVQDMLSSMKHHLHSSTM